MIPLDEALRSLCETLDYRYKQLMHGDEALHLIRFITSNMLGFGEWRSLLNRQAMRFEGKITGVDESGRLMLLGWQEGIQQVISTH